ncbi:MAG: hypothetical protein ACYC2T_08175 [Bacillota bacterium]
MSWAEILIGWPAILGSLLISIIGLVLLRPRWLIAGAIVITGFGWVYLVGSPSLYFKLIGFSLPLLHLAAALATAKRLRWVAAILLLPHLAVAIYIGLLVLGQ